MAEKLDYRNDDSVTCLADVDPETWQRFEDQAADQRADGTEEPPDTPVDPEELV